MHNILILLIQYDRVMCKDYMAANDMTLPKYSLAALFSLYEIT